MAPLTKRFLPSRHHSDHRDVSTKPSLAESLIQLPKPTPTARLLKKCHIERQPQAPHAIIRSTCQTTCSPILGHGDIPKGTDLYFTDPAVVELLLTCLASDRGDIRFDLYPGCPISNLRLASCIAALPALSTLSPHAFSRAPHGRFGPSQRLSRRHRTLLTWLLTSTFSHLATIRPPPTTLAPP